MLIPVVHMLKSLHHFGASVADYRTAELGTNDGALSLSAVCQTEFPPVFTALGQNGSFDIFFWQL